MVEQGHIRLDAGNVTPSPAPLAPRTAGSMPMSDLVLALKAASDETRLKLLALCRRSELTVSELVWILGQSQPRVSRHLKLLCDAGLLERAREGAWVYYRLSLDGAHAVLASALDDLIEQGDPDLATELVRLDSVRQPRTGLFQPQCRPLG